MKNHPNFQNRKFTIEFILSISALALTMMMFAKFTAFVEMRNGMQLNDPVLGLFQAMDLTKLIFTLVYGAILIALLSLISRPYQLMLLLQAYTLMVLTRTAMMYVLPLTPPAGMIILQDPLVEFFGSGKPLLNDLFFSGHTATLSLLYLGVPEKLKKLFLVMAITTAISVLLQKTHYTVDVLVAPFVSFACYHLVTKSHES